jgi:UDP-N-acetylmuramoyl-L-alanyl-D-glutamate--2,6-diaminopimelate ligase
LKNLKDILYKVSIHQVFGNTDISVSQLVFDSRKIEKNDVFVAQKGVSVNGHLYIAKIFLRIKNKELRIFRLKMLM